MAPYWLSFISEIRTRPDITDVTPYLDRGLKVLRSHPDIASVTCRHNTRTHRVTFALELTYTIAPHHDIVTGHHALHESLQRAGICTTRQRRSGPLPAVQARIDTWADLVRPA